MCLAYLQIGIMQALAGFYAWMLVLNDYGFPPVVLIGNPGATAPTGKLGFFADQVMYCKYNGGAYLRVTSMSVVSSSSSSAFGRSRGIESRCGPKRFVEGPETTHVHHSWTRVASMAWRRRSTSKRGDHTCFAQVSTSTRKGKSIL